MNFFYSHDSLVCGYLVYLKLVNYFIKCSLVLRVYILRFGR